LPAVLYGCETWFPTLREKHGLTVYDAVLLSKIFEPKRNEETGDCRGPRNKGLHDLYCLTEIIRVIKSRRIKWEGHVARMGERRSAYRILVGKPEGKKPLGKPRHSLEFIIKTDNQE